jgi:transcriptional regulator with XRE-family HTH domain
MRIPVQTPSDLGVVIRALRKSAAVRQDDLAASVGVSKQFASDVEHGKPTAQVGLLMKVLEELGGRLEVEVPDHLQPMVAELQQRFVAQQGKHQKRSRRATRATCATDPDQPGEDR